MEEDPSQLQAVLEAVDDVISGSKEEGKMVLAMARTLFEEADADHSGEIDEHELWMVLEKLYAKMGRPVSVADRQGMQQQVRRCMQLFDKDQSGTIDFEEFLKMIIRDPWREMLPPEGIKQATTSAPKPPILKPSLSLSQSLNQILPRFCMRCRQVRPCISPSTAPAWGSGSDPCISPSTAMLGASMQGTQGAQWER